MATPEGDSFAAAAGEAVQTSVMAWRLVMAMADAVRRQHQRLLKGREEEPPPAEQAVGEAAREVAPFLPPDISTALMGEADWPQMAQQLVALRDAGVDLQSFVPRVAEIAVTVRDEVRQKAAASRPESTEKWERLLRETMPAGPVREAILASPRWPDITASLGRLEERGVDVRRVLAAAHNSGVAVHEAAARSAGAETAPVVSRDAVRSYGPLTAGLDLPKDLDLSDRARALRQLAISPAENQRYGQWVLEAVQGHERMVDAGQVLTHRQWPLLAARMAQMEDEGKPVREYLARLVADTSWQEGPRSAVSSRMVEAINEALRRPLGDSGSRVRVNTTAARAASTSLDPKRAAKAATPAETGVAAHRPAGPASARGKTR
ncbi:hypothetical protein ACFWII_34020 [Streptomyces sp. NPDC127063]|uniref:hypothetical protein n=1 Tax=Streptomyces sp. NPDC127063 TaxID=3347123 RepID=UPI003648B8D8